MVLVAGSQTERGDGKVKDALGISHEAVPGNEQVESSHSESQASLKLVPGSMKDLLEMANGGQQRQSSLN